MNALAFLFLAALTLTILAAVTLLHCAILAAFLEAAFRTCSKLLRRYISPI